MSPSIKITIHWSQFPDRVRSDLQESLRTRRLNHKFLYDSLRQTRKWLALHQAHSPARTDPDCAATYDRSFAGAIARLPSGPVHLVGLGCGGGQKDTRLLQLLRNSKHRAQYTPADVSTAMVLVAGQAAQSVIPAGDCFPLVCDLASADDLGPELEQHERDGAARLITFFGMIPNFEPSLIVPRLASLVRPGDWLLFSANLAPGPDYQAGLEKILPLYDNELTRDWLLGFLLDAGVEPGDGELRFSIEADPASDLKRVTARFHFERPRSIQVEDERFDFRAGDALQVFFSYRHTPQKIRDLLGQHHLRVMDEWVTRSGEEGVFLVKSE